MEHPHGFPPLSAIGAVLICAALMIAFYQALFPRPARWGLAGVAFVLGGALTVLLTRLLTPTADRLHEIHDLWSALRVVVTSVGLPEEGVKFLAAVLTLLLFRRRLTPAEGFQAALFAALGFAAVENTLYARAFPEAALPLAFGRGIIASFVHSMMGMIQGTFLAAFLRSGSRRIYLPVIGYLLAAAAHSSFDWGLLRPMVEYLDTKNVRPETVIAALPLAGTCIVIVLIVALWLLRRQTRLVAAEDPRGSDPAFDRRRARWRQTGDALIILGAMGLVASIAGAVWLQMSGMVPKEAAPAALTPDQVRASFAVTAILAAAPMAMIFGFICRQKR